MSDISNLGIYNNIDQGIEFMNYRNANSDRNKFAFLSTTSSPQVGSITEAFNAHDSMWAAGAPAAVTEPFTVTGNISTDEAHFNSLLSDYARSYQTFNTALLKKKPSRKDLKHIKDMEQDLHKKYVNLASLASSIKGNIDKLNSTRGTIQAHLNANGSLIQGKMDQLTATNMRLQPRNVNYSSLDGRLETSKLNTTSIQIHYIVYLLIAITIIAYLFYIVFNPNANVMNALYVVSILIAIYVVSRWII